MSDESKPPNGWNELNTSESHGRLSREHAEELLRYPGEGKIPDAPPSQYKLREAMLRIKGLDAASVARLMPEELHELLHELGVSGELEAVMRFPGHGELVAGETVETYHNDVWHTDAHSDYQSFGMNWPGHTDAHTDYKHSDTRQKRGDTGQGKKHEDTGEHLDTGEHGDYPHGDHDDAPNPRWTPHWDEKPHHYDHTDAAREPIHCDYRSPPPHGDREGPPPKPDPKHVDV